MNKLYFLCVLLFVGVCQAYSSFFSIDGSVDNTCGPKKCTQQGTHCKDCNTLVKCIEDEDGNYFEIPLLTCNSTEGKYCFQDKECSTEFNPCCNAPNYNFKCSSIGMFPDPFDCTKYHVCIKDKLGKYSNYTYVCQEKWGYNMITTYCDVPLVSNNCPIKPPAPKCEKLGDTGHLDNPSIWYICVQQGKAVVPELHLCPHGYWFDGDMCVSKEQFTTTASTGHPETTTTQMPETTTRNRNYEDE